MSGNDPTLRFLELITGTPPAVLYHYTSMEGLLGIVQSGRIRASDSRYLNDRTESTHIYELLKNHISQKVIKTTGTDRKCHEDLLLALEKPTIYDVFVASFSERGDWLSQWRAYSRGGIGFSIGFDAKSLRAGYISDTSSGKPQSVRGQLANVRYLSNDADSSLDEVLNAVKEIAVSMSTIANPPIGLGEATARCLAVFAPMFKHRAFEEEREWRLILSEFPSPMPAKRFRVGKSALVPYVEAEPLIKESYFIKEVIVGPTPHPELSKDSVTALFQSLDHPGVTVRTSNVPYRHW